jgi:hypothetical protein
VGAEKTSPARRRDRPYHSIPDVQRDARHVARSVPDTFDHADGLVPEDAWGQSGSPTTNRVQIAPAHRAEANPNTVR